MPGSMIAIPGGMSAVSSPAAGQQRAGVGQHDRIIVDVDHLRGGHQLLRHLVQVGGRRDTGADVEELIDPGPAGQMAHRAMQERPVLLSVGPQLRKRVPAGPVGPPAGPSRRAAIRTSSGFWS